MVTALAHRPDHLADPAGHFAVAFALGAVVAPPDAVAATSIARRVGLPRRVVTVLEGESLVNDATAITCLRVGHRGHRRRGLRRGGGRRFPDGRRRRSVLSGLRSPQW